MIYEIKELLQKIGLTKQESKVYVALLQIGEAKTGKLCSYTNIASSNIYGILESLIKKGLINYRVENNIKVFMAANPETLHQIFEKKQEELEKEKNMLPSLISNLKKFKSVGEPYSNYKYFEGIVGIKSMWHEINEVMKEEIICYTGKQESYQSLLGFYNEHHKLRIKRKIRARLIFPKEEQALAKKRTDQFTQIKFLKLENEAEWGVTSDYIYMQHYINQKTPVAFLIKDKAFAKTFKQVFEQIWKN